MGLKNTLSFSIGYSTKYSEIRSHGVHWHGRGLVTLCCRKCRGAGTATVRCLMKSCRQSVSHCHSANSPTPPTGKHLLLGHGKNTWSRNTHLQICSPVVMEMEIWTKLFKSSQACMCLEKTNKLSYHKL